MNDPVKTIIEKLEKDTAFTVREKAYIEKAIRMVDYFDDLCDMSLGLTKNTAGLKFNVHPYVDG